METERTDIAERQDESGQTVAEYGLLTLFCVLVLIGATVAVLDGTATFYEDVVRLICLPLP
jgi:Flp pilus assembly pilin Flp